MNITHPQTLAAFRHIGTEIAIARQDFISSLVQSLRGDEISLADALYAMGCAGLEVGPIVNERFRNAAQR